MSSQFNVRPDFGQNVFLVHCLSQLIGRDEFLVQKSIWTDVFQFNKWGIMDVVVSTVHYSTRQLVLKMAFPGDKSKSGNIRGVLSIPRY